MAKSTNDEYISASEIGDYLYCQRAWWLQRRGVENFRPEVLSQGTIKHGIFQRQVQNTKRTMQLGAQLMLVGVAVFIIMVAIKLLSGQS